MLPVAIRQVSKSYDGATPVLGGIDLEIGAGEMFFLLGASGCGKTTLLRLIGGFIQPDHGQIRFGDEDVTAQPAERRNLGMVFQNYALWPHLTVGENIAFGLDVRGVPAAETRTRVDEALALVELSGYAARRIGELSGGQQQRVALARAVVVRPRLLLLDEPLSNLDARLRTVMRSEIRRVCKTAGLTAIYVTHDQHEALSTADRIAVMSGGAVAQVGTPRELYEHPVNRTVAAFLGEANLLPATVSGPRTVTCVLGTLACAELPSAFGTGAKVLVCLRPERIRIGGDGRENRFSAAIAAQSYFGDRARWLVEVAGQRLAINESAPPPRQIGDRLELGVALPDVTVLPAAPA